MISRNMAVFSVSRTSDELDDFGIASSSPASAYSPEVLVSIFKDSPAKDSANPMYDVTPYVGLTRAKDIRLGDILTNGSENFQVKNIGNRGAHYLALFLVKL